MPLILEGGLLHIATSAIRATLAMVTLNAGFTGQLRREVTMVGRLVLIAVGFVWVVPHWMWDLLGLLRTVPVFLDRLWIYRLPAPSPHALGMR